MHDGALRNHNITSEVIANTGIDRRGRRGLVKVDTGSLRMEPIGKSEFLLFRFLEFRFFWRSPNGRAIPMLYGNPAWLEPLIVIPYMLASLAHVRNFGGAKYFIRQGKEVAGILILKVRRDVLDVLTLGVSPVKRRLGVGIFALAQAEGLAKRMGLRWLELEVLKGNTPAQRLYWKFGFITYAERSMTLVLRKRV